MIETAATLTDEIVALNDRLIGGFFTKSKKKYERAFAEQGKAIRTRRTAEQPNEFIHSFVGEHVLAVIKLKVGSLSSAVHRIRS